MKNKKHTSAKDDVRGKEELIEKMQTEIFNYCCTICKSKDGCSGCLLDKYAPLYSGK